MSSSEFHERLRSNPLCDFRLGTVATSDHETPLTKKKRQRKNDNTKVYPKEAEEVSLHKNKHQILKSGQKRTLLGETKDAKARKACQKAMMAFTRVVFSPLPAR